MIHVMTWRGVMMKKRSVSNELWLVGIAIICALLLILGHVILTKSFANMAWAEYTAAAIPFILFALYLFGIKSAAKDQQKQRE